MTVADGPADTSAYTVLARRYRPAHFDACVGQEHVAQSLKNAIETGRVAHAYLFCGSRGVGKTSMARIFAKSLNCKTGPTTRPCGECESCVAIAAGSDLDVIEIDGASNRGIEEIRDLRAGVAFRASHSRYKIYIIDEVHMLTKEAFNALLKTLEEPPAHVKFIFATTEAQKIPITILSRCQRYDFAPIGMAGIEQRLREIVAAEGMTADEEAVSMIARRARGSMRDSQSLLDQVMAFSGGTITPATVHSLLGTAGEDRVIELVEAILSGQSAQGLRLIATAMDEGVQIGEWLDQILEYFRDVLVLSVDPQAGILSMSERMRDTMLAQAKSRTPERILEIMDILAACRLRLRSTTMARTLFEMTVVRLCRLDSFLNLARAAESAPAPASPLPSTSRPASPQVKKNAEAPALAPSFNPTPAATSTSATPVIQNGSQIKRESDKRAVNLQTLDWSSIWSQVKASIPDAFLAAGLGRVTNIKADSPTTVLLEFSPGATTSKRHCEEKSDVIRSAFEAVIGQTVGLRFDFGQASASAPAAQPRRSQMQLRDDVRRDPLVKEAESLLGATIVGEVVATSPAQVGPADSGTTEED